MFAQGSNLDHINIHNDPNRHCPNTEVRWVISGQKVSRSILLKLVCILKVIRQLKVIYFRHTHISFRLFGPALVSSAYTEDLIKACFIYVLINPKPLFKCNIIHFEKAITACSPLFMITLAAIKTPPKSLIIGISCWDFLPAITPPPSSKGSLKQARLLC